MSVVSFVLSSRSSSSRYKVNDRLASIMDSIFAIGAGLGLRFLVDAASRHSFKITGTLVGLWEGVILLHFLKKAPRSSDPFIAYGVRLFIDFLVTESIGRLVLVIIWTCLGMVLADISPVYWNNTGLRRVWRRIRQDFYTLSEMIPTVVFTSPPRRTVRFSPSRTSSVISEVASDADVLTEAPSMYTPSVATELLPPSSIIPTTTLPTTAPPTTITMTVTEATSRRRLPGYLPGMLSDTESMVSSILGRGRHATTTTTSYDPSRTSRRLSVFPTRDYDSASSVTSGSPSQNGEEIDDDNDEYTTTPSSQSSEMQEQATTPGFDISQMTEIPDEEELLPITSPPGVQVQMAQAVAVKEETTPTPRHPIPLPPTPSDSQATRRRELPGDEPVVIPSIMPQIPDEEGAWEGSRRSGAPSPVAKDWPHSSTADNTPRHFNLPTPDQSRVIPRRQGPGQEGWDLFASQFMEKPVGHDAEDEKRSLKSNDGDTFSSKGKATPNGNGHAPVRRQSTQPPPYATWEHVDTSNIDDIYGDEVNEKSSVASPLRPDTVPTRDSFAAFTEQLERDEAAKAQKQRDEMERVRLEQETAKLQQQKVEEEIRQRQEEERQKAEEERLRVEAEEQKLREMEEEMDRRAAAFAVAEAEALRHAQEEERKRREAEAEVLRLKLAEEERLRREAEAEVLRLKQEAAERTRREDEVERLRREAEAEAAGRREEEERLRQEAAVAEEALRLQREAEEKERRREESKAKAESLRLQQEEEERVRREAEAEVIALRLQEEENEERLRQEAEDAAETLKLQQEAERQRLEAEAEAEYLRLQQEEERLRQEAEAKATLKADKAAKKAKKLERERKKAEKEERLKKEEEDTAAREQKRLEAEQLALREEQERAAALEAEEAERQRAENEERQRLEEANREMERQQLEAEEEAQRQRIQEENTRLRQAQEQEEIERLRHEEEEEVKRLEAIRAKAEEDDHRRLQEGTWGNGEPLSASAK